MKLNKFVKYVLMVIILAGILETGRVVTGAIFGNSIFSGSGKTAFYGGIFTGMAHGLAAAFLSLWIVKPYKPKGIVIHCKDCKYWLQECDVCHHVHGMCATGEKARENACSLWERREDDETTGS